MKVTFGEKLKQARTDKKLKQSELAKQLGVTNTTISNWENNISKPDLDMLSYICGALSVKVSYFLEAKLPEDQITIPEFNIIKKYRDLDGHGKEMVDFTLQKEWERSKAERTNNTSAKPAGKLIQYYQRLASAGSGQFVFDNIPTDMIEIPDIPKYKKVKYAIGVKGRSMEPEFYEGDTLLIEPTDTIEYGEIGIFISDGDAFVKKLGIDELISINEEYKNIPLTQNTKCVGRVIDRINDALSNLSEEDLDAIMHGSIFGDKSSSLMA